MLRKSSVIAFLVVFAFLEIVTAQSSTNDKKPLDETAFQTFIGTIQRTYFGSNRLLLLSEETLGSWQFSSEQVLRILEIFTHESDRLTTLEILWPRVVDPQNRVRIYRAFFFPSNKTLAQKIMQQSMGTTP